MKLVFTKGDGKYDVMEIFRPDAQPERVECPKQRIIPHDMVHYAVEHTLDARGFLGRLRDGENADFRMPAEQTSDAVERLVEVFQGDEWSGGTSSPADMIAMYKLTCEARKCAALPLDDAAVLAVRTAIVDLSGRWQAIPVGGELTLDM